MLADNGMNEVYRIADFGTDVYILYVPVLIGIYKIATTMVERKSDMVKK